MLWKLTPRVYCLPNDPAADRPVLGYLRGDRFPVMIDAGNSPAHAALFLEELRKLGQPFPRFVALTHWHWDHTYGLPGLDAAAIACFRTGRILERMAEGKWDEASMAGQLHTGEDIPFCDEMIRREYPDRSTIVLRPAASSLRTGWISSPAGAPVRSYGSAVRIRTTASPLPFPGRGWFSSATPTAKTCATASPATPAPPPNG